MPVISPSESETIIIELLSKNKSMSVDELVNKLSAQNQISERQVKETIWTLLEKRRIIPNKQWKMKIRS